MRKILALGAIVGIITATFAASPAFAVDPEAPRTINGGGSDTTQDVLSAIQNVAGAQFGSYDSIGGTFSPKPGCTFNSNLPTGTNGQGIRPNGSSAGRDRLRESIKATGGAPGAVNQRASDGSDCLDFARSSSAPGTPDASAPLTYLAFAIDGLSYATTDAASVSATLSLAALRTLYSANGTPGTAACNNLAPLLPQSGSGTRATFLANIGVGGSGQPAIGTCVRDTALNRNTGAVESIQENKPFFLTAANQILPYSTSAWAAQQGRQAPGELVTGLRLGAIAGSNTLVASPDFVNRRTVYNVVSTPRLGEAAIAQTFVGSSSFVCQQTAVISRFGYAVAPNCGSGSAG